MDCVRKVFVDENKKGVSYREMGKITQVNFTYLYRVANGEKKVGPKIVQAAKIIKFFSS